MKHVILFGVFAAFIGGVAFAQMNASTMSNLSSNMTNISNQSQALNASMGNVSSNMSDLSSNISNTTSAMNASLGNMSGQANQSNQSF